MLPGLFFTTWRIFEILTLIPTVGMLSWFVHIFTKANALTPTSILVLFIVSVIALFWALATLLAYSSTKYNAQFVAVVDLLLVGAFIAGVYYLRGIGHANCAQWKAGSHDSGYLDLGWGGVSGSVNTPFGIKVDGQCAMLKASWAFGIMNCIFFFVTFLILLWVARHHHDHYRGSSRSVRRSSYTSRSHHSRSPRRSHHSTRRYSRTYV